MSQSAFLGDPPVTSDDKLIHLAIKYIAGSLFFPDKSHPYGAPKPSLDAPNEYNGYRVKGAAASMIVFVILITVGRFWIRKRQKLNYGVDDYMVIPAALTAIVYCALEIYWTSELCYGRHIYFCTYDMIAQLYEGTYVNQTIFYFGVYSAKVSIIFFNRRLTAFTLGWWNTAHFVILFIVISFGLFSLFTTMFVCVPIGPHYSLIALAQADRKRSKCLNIDNIQVTNRALHITSDLMLLSVPLIILYRLQMPLRKKLSIGGLFCFGVVTVLASIMRNVVWQHPTDDFTFQSTAIFTWDIIDITFASIVASLPIYYSVLDAIFQRTRSILSRYTSSHQSSSNSNPKRSPFGRGPDVLLSHTNPRHRDTQLDGVVGCYIRSDAESEDLEGLSRAGASPGAIFRTDEIESTETRLERGEGKGWVDDKI